MDSNPLSEFALIERFFEHRVQRLPTQTLGIGDDCALIAPLADQALAISTDMLIEGRHFFADVEARALGHKALAVNLSDLAAMGAKPRAFTLALALPNVNENWLAAFSDGLFACAERFECALIGGDTTRGPRTICITVFGDVPPHLSLRRGAAQAGDDVWVSGTLGDARAGLGVSRNEWQAANAADAATFRHALEYPEPRVALGLALRGVAHAALDLSDGLAGDLPHILRRSQVSAFIDIEAIPRSSALRRLPLETQHCCALTGGDDYELCFTAPIDARDAITQIGRQNGLLLSRIGTISPLNASAPAIIWRDAAGIPLPLTLQGFDHFHAPSSE